MNPHTGAAITLPPDFEDPHVLDLEATALCALLTLFLQRTKEVGGGGQALSQTWQRLFKVSSHSHAAESTPVNHT